MSESIQTASLVLYTAQASSALVSNTQLIWNNINLRKICGDNMYEKYNTFNLVLHTISTTSTSVAFNTAALTAASIDDRNILLAITGPAWLNNSYVWLNGTNTNTSIMGNYQISVGAAGGNGPPTTTVYPQVNVNTFAKSAASFDIGISYKRIIPNATTGSYNVAGIVNGITTQWPDMVFIFDIIGVELAKPKNELLDIHGRAFTIVR
ncbi:hypothetical protein EB001_07925 [bacterium]|nr:hypothetical protein [bacterium]